MKPDIKYITPYLPYQLQIPTDLRVYLLRSIDIMSNPHIWVKAQWDMGLMSKASHISKDWSGIQLGFKLEEIKPLLKPLDSLLTDCPGEIMDEFSVGGWSHFSDCVGLGLFDAFENIPAASFMKMIELHYDVFQLIPQGLALDINTVVTK